MIENGQVIGEPEWVPDSAARCSARWWDKPLAALGVLMSLALSTAIILALLLLLSPPANAQTVDPNSIIWTGSADSPWSPDGRYGRPRRFFPSWIATSWPLIWIHNVDGGSVG